MVNRKATPDVLSELLSDVGDDEVVIISPEPPPAKPARAKRTARAAKPKAPPQPEPPVWEYLEVIFREYQGWRPRALNGRRLSDWKEQPPMHEYLNRLGQEGWEMIGMAPRGLFERETYFKRRGA